MPATSQTAIFDAFRKASERGELPTSLGTAELRELGADVLSSSVFTARGTNAIYVSKLKEVVDAMASRDMDEATARVTLLETLRAVGYTPEGGFPDAPAGSVPPAVKGTLQDLSSFRRLDLIVSTQRALMRGAGQKLRGHTSERLATFPAWRLLPSTAREPRIDWESRWIIAGGKPGPLIALKGDPVWGELGSYENFPDALGVDHGPFYFGSTRDLGEVSADEVQKLGITGPDGESSAEFHATRPATLGGRLPAPTLSTKKMDPAIREVFEKRADAVTVQGTATPSNRAEELRERMRKRLEDAKARDRQTIAERGAA